MTEENVFHGYGVEIDILNDDNFLKIKETLTRIGIASHKNKELYQSCHILHKRGKYAIVHFKEMFALDGRSTSLDEQDIKRRNYIAKLLEQWNLCKLISPSQLDVGTNGNVKIVSFSDKKNWTLISKYSIGQ